MKKKQLLKLLKTSTEVRKAKGKYDLIFFARYYLKRHLKYETPDFHKEWIEANKRHQRIYIACPRGHAKSAWWSFIFILHAILYKEKTFIVLLSDTQTQANEFLGQIIQELETNETIIRDFGKIAGYVPPTAEEKKKWTMSDIVTLTNVKVIARGFTAKLRGIKHDGKRPGLIVLDDVENDQSVQSKLQRDKYKSIYKKSILNLGDEDTKIVVVGTVLHYDSLLAELVNKEGKDIYTRLYKAIQDDGSVLWEERWDIKDLEKKKKDIGSIAFEQEYMNNPLNDKEKIFKYIHYHKESYIPDKFEVYAYVDLAISEKETADYTAIVPIGKKKETGELYSFPSERIRGTIHDQINLVFSMHSRYKFQLVGIESVAYQKAFYQVLQKEKAKRNIYDMGIKEIKIDKDKVRRAVEVTHLTEEGTAKIYKDDSQLIEEIQTFPKGMHDDLVDSFVGGVKLSTQSQFEFISNY